MLVIPAIDLKDGECVRLVEGRLGTERTVSHDAVAQAKAFEAAGAQRLHVVDLDGAFEGRPKNATLIARIAHAVDIPVQVGGGLRTREAVQAVFDAGASYAILGTMAVDDPETFSAIANAFNGRIIAGIDGRDGRVATDGWMKDSERTIEDVARFAAEAGAAAIITTDIARDGTGQGVNATFTDDLAHKVPIEVIASGGVRDLSDIQTLAGTSVAGVVVGRALYDGDLDLATALRVVRELGA